MESRTSVASPAVAASQLFDVVVFAGGKADGLRPLCDNEPKPMLCICNQPMIWYCLYPWYAAGCRTFFVTVNEDYAALQSYLHRVFHDVEFVFVLVPFTQNEAPSTTCDVVKAYLEHKESLLPSKLGHARDALLLSCDTLLPGLDLEPFIRNFYCSVASVSVLLFRPLKNTHTPAAAGTKANRKHDTGFPPKPYTFRYTCTAYEELDEAVNGTSTANSRGDGETDRDTNGPCSYRLHIMCPYEERLRPYVSMGFGARRPNLTFACDTTDAHVYLVRHWALHAIADSAGEGRSVQRDCIPFFALNQHSTINEKHSLFARPENKIKYNIPKHWLFERDCFVNFLNASPGPVLPAEADNLLVCCTIYDERPETYMRAYRVRTCEDYIAVNKEIIFSKCLLHGANETMPRSATSGTAKYTHPPPHQQQQPQSIQRPSQSFMGKQSIYRAVNSSRFPFSAMALSGLVSDSAFTIRADDVSRGITVIHSFLRTSPTCKATIARSIIGNNVTLGPDVRISNSIILDNAEIGAGATISNSVIGSSAMVTAGVKVMNCTVGPQCLVESHRIEKAI
ncbi:GDP-mannose pyrophosphorylase [Trypanosoma rangeli]|uniref:Translation initiation factor eIF2B subunit gamma n=1 Tax=Trypanosoma rangeli TaxID=5698 RepID=A0A3R7REE6_TRYRA|nr:GDP-mannose pyrophosphorylase [Trypanosoma rangeli]RNF00986.1 GDP-mannose pyrophosphorylase [Trypanosoma rangeli]|eukprot:RNF00986.1 GDP-mannose pyrophosphorylase [Trypanosoma rangeli]